MTTEIERLPGELNPDLIEWLENKKVDDVPDMDDLISWIVVDEKTETFKNESQFCDSKIQNELVAIQEKFNEMSDAVLRRCAMQTNPFEKIERVFMDRAANKLANINVLCNFMFTKPLDTCGESLVRDKQYLQFVAIESHPGGFVDYMLCCKKWQTQGFHITSSNYRINKFTAEYTPFRLISLNDPASGLINPENIEAFVEKVRRETKPTNGIHVALADCALPIERARQSKETMSKRLHMSCLVTALGVLCPGGHFIMKIFDAFSPLTVGLIYLAYKCFTQISIIKPASSRPANSERYLIGKGKLPNTNTIYRHLLEICAAMMDESSDVVELVSVDVLQLDTQFFDYIVNSNNAIATHQIVASNKLLDYHRNAAVKDSRQQQVYDKYMVQWRLSTPSEGKWSQDQSIENYCTSLFGLKYDFVIKLFNEYIKPVTKNSHPICDRNKVGKLCFVPIGSESKNRTLYICKTKGNVIHMYDTTKHSWVEVSNKNLYLPSQTLVYGELISVKFKDNSDGFVFYIIDALILGGIDVSASNLFDRASSTHQFILSMNTRQYRNAIPINSFKKEPVKNLTEFITNLHRSDNVIHQMTNFKRNQFSYKPNGLLFLNFYPSIHKSLDSNNYSYLWDWSNPECEAKGDFHSVFRLFNC